MVRFIIVLIILILALSYFGISLRDVAQSPTGQENFSFVWGYIQEGWEIITTWLATFLAAVKNVFT